MKRTFLSFVAIGYCVSLTFGVSVNGLAPVHGQETDGIEYGGELPAPDSSEPVPESDVDDAIGPLSDELPNPAMPSRSSDGTVTILSIAADEFESALGELKDLPAASEWRRDAKRLSDTIIAMDVADPADVQEISGIARGLDRSISRLLQEGLPQAEFAAVRDVRDLLTDRLIAAMEPLESEHGIEPPEMVRPETTLGGLSRSPWESRRIELDASGNRVLSRPPVESPLGPAIGPRFGPEIGPTFNDDRGFDRGFDPRSAVIPVLPPVTSYRPGYRGPGFELRLDIAPPAFAPFSYSPFLFDYDYDRTVRDPYGYRGRLPSYLGRDFGYGYGGFRYESYRSPFGGGFYGGGFGGIPILPYGYGPAGFGIPVLPYGHH